MTWLTSSQTSSFFDNHHQQQKHLVNVVSLTIIHSLEIQSKIFVLLFLRNLNILQLSLVLLLTQKVIYPFYLFSLGI